MRMEFKTIHGETGAISEKDLFTYRKGEEYLNDSNQRIAEHIVLFIATTEEYFEITKKTLYDIKETIQEVLDFEYKHWYEKSNIYKQRKELYGEV